MHLLGPCNKFLEGTGLGVAIVVNNKKSHSKTQSMTRCDNLLLTAEKTPKQHAQHMHSTIKYHHFC